MTVARDIDQRTKTPRYFAYWKLLCMCARLGDDDDNGGLRWLVTKQHQHWESAGGKTTTTVHTEYASLCLLLLLTEF